MMFAPDDQMGFRVRLRGPAALASVACLMLAGAFALAAGQFGLLSRFALMAAVLFGMQVVIDPGREFSVLTRREARFGPNAAILWPAMIGILVALNIVAAHVSQRWDVTAQRTFTLSEQTLEVLRGLPEPVHATGYFSLYRPDRQRTEDLLKEYAVRSNGTFTYEMVDPFPDRVMPGYRSRHEDGTIRFQMGDRENNRFITVRARSTTAPIKRMGPDSTRIDAEH